MTLRSSAFSKCLAAALPLGALAYLAIHFQPHSPAQEQHAASSSRTLRPVTSPTPVQDVSGEPRKKEYQELRAREEKRISGLRELTTEELADLFRTLIPQKDDPEADHLRNLILQILGERSAAKTAFALIAAWNQAHPSVNAPPDDDTPAAEDIIFEEQDSVFIFRPGLLAQFYRYYPVTPAILLAELKHFPDPDDRRRVLEGYTDFGSLEPDAPATFERLRTLLEFSAHASDDRLRLTPGEREVILRQQVSLFLSQIGMLFPIHSDEASQEEIVRTVMLNKERVAMLAPVLSEAEQNLMRGVMAQELVSRRPYLAWELATSGAKLHGGEDSLLSGMLKAGTDRATAALSTATAQQSDIIAAAFPSGEDEEDAFASRLPAEQLNTAATALFNAAISRNDPDRARQWLERITDPAAHSEAEKKLPAP